MIYCNLAENMSNCINIHPLLVDAPVALITTLSLFGLISIRFAYLDVAVFHFSFFFYFAKRLKLCQVAWDHHE